MHLFKKSISFIAVMCVFSAAYAAISAPSRVGVIAKNSGSSRRLPSLSNISKSYIRYSTSSTSSTGSGLLSDAECIDDYRECMKSDSACGAGFENCTTNVLFHGHMAECYSTLTKCSASAIIDLMGTSNLSALSTVDSYVVDTNDTEVARYTYPTDGSLMGMDIIGAATRNKLSTADCVKKYKRCLNKDSVCGEDFELCTSDDEFKKQAVLCDSTLARCQKEGFQQIFGSAITTKPANQRLRPNADGDAHRWIEDGATLAAANAVNTCYKVVDNCFLSACAKNPYNCVEGVDFSVVNSAQSIVEPGIDVNTVNYTGVTGKQMANDVRKFFRAACTDTIGSNQYCFMTFNNGQKPTKADLQDEDLREDIFGEAYNTRKTTLTTNVNALVEKFDKNAVDKCLDTFKTCAVNSCGGGSGAACYARVFGGSNINPANNRRNQNLVKTINFAGVGGVYDDIANGCRAVVNTDANCRYMAAMQDDGTYSFNMGGTDTTTFDMLFPKYDANLDNDKVAVVAELNKDLSTAYNDAAIEQMKTKCKSVVTNCVRSMCGSEFQNCYRNRNDITVATYDTGNSRFDRSMNKMGGILDYTIVQGLCGATVRTADACTETFALARMGVNTDMFSTGWGSASGGTLNNAWRTSAQGNVYKDDLVEEKDDNNNNLCLCNDGGKLPCGSVDSTNQTCNEQSYVSLGIMIDKTAVNTVFQDILVEVENQAQAQYKAKLTREQNACLAENGLAGTDSTFVWAKLKGTEVGSDYNTKGLQNSSEPSNDLYGSFCRVRVELKSSDRYVLNGINNNTASAYFAAGDAFTCGAWLSDDDLNKISENIADQARKDAGEGSQHDKNTRIWTAVAGGLVGGIGSFIAMDKLQDGSSILGGLVNNRNARYKRSQSATEACINKYEDVMSKYNAAKVKASAAAAAEESKEAAAKEYYKSLQSLETAANSFRQTVRKTQNTLKQNDIKVDSSVGDHVFSVSGFDKNAKIDSYSSNTFDQNGNEKQEITDLYKKCETMDGSVSGDGYNGNRLLANGIAATVGSVATMALANGITVSAQKAKYENAANEAVKKFMDGLHDKIRCYVGNQDAGGFGDILSVNIDVD